jgi:dolichol-phosphate mannosyltransferase
LPDQQAAGAPQVCVVIPARDEGENIATVLDRLFDLVRCPCEVIVVTDGTSDTTAEVLTRYESTEPRLTCLTNRGRPGRAAAIKLGFESAKAPVVVVTAANGSDDLAQIDELVTLVNAGAVIASASRYSIGGGQLGGPSLRGMLSHLLGSSLRLLARAGTRDATNSFKAYSADFARSVGIESRHGFQIGIELTAKARRLRLPVAEIPTTWLDLPGSTSPSMIVRWLPGYLRWYLFCFGRRLTLGQLRARAAAGD